MSAAAGEHAADLRVLGFGGLGCRDVAATKTGAAAHLPASTTDEINTPILLERGAINVVLGRNGAGKTALCRLIAGLDPPGSARVMRGAEELTRLDTRKRRVGLVFGEFVNYPGLTVAENIAAPLRATGMQREMVQTRVHEMATRVGLAPMLDRLPEQLSGGQQQRVALARAMARQPDVLLLDEPLANLDYKLRETMEGELRELFAGSATVVVYTTSDPREALQLADRLILLDAGSAIAQGAPLELLRAPASAAAADLLSDPGINLFAAHRSGTTLTLAGGLELPAPGTAHGVSTDAESDHEPAGESVGESSTGEEPVWVGIRPDHLRPAHHAEADADGIRLIGEVQLAETTGSDTYLHLRIGAADWVAHLDGLHTLAPGERVELCVHPQDILVFPLAPGVAASPSAGAAAATPEDPARGRHAGTQSDTTA